MVRLICCQGSVIDGVERKKNVYSLIGRPTPAPIVRIAFAFITQDSLAVRREHSFTELWRESAKVAVLQAQRPQSFISKGDVAYHVCIRVDSKRDFFQQVV